MFSKNVISVDIGAQSIALVVGKKVKNLYIIDDAFTIPTPPNCFSDGRITNIEALSGLIKQYILEKNIKAKDLIFTLSSSGIITREIILPAKKSDNLESMINFEISQYLPVDLSQYIVEYKYLEEFEEDGVKKSRILVAAVQKSVVDGYYELANMLGLNPVAMDISSNAIAKLMLDATAVNQESYNSLDTIATIDIGHASLNITILNEGRIGLSRIITQGSSAIDKCIADKFEIPMIEAEKIKLEELDLDPDAELTPSGVKQLESIEYTINEWIRDIERIIMFYESRNANKKVGSVFIYGGGSNMKGLAQFMQKSMNIPIYSLNIVNNIKLDDKIKDLNLKHYFNAIGAIPNRKQVWL